MSNLKKFLIISSYAPPAISGAPVMMYNLLCNFPKDSFVILTSHAHIDNRMIEHGQYLKTKYYYFDTPTLTTSLKKEGSFFQKAKNFFKKSILLKNVIQFLFIFYLPFNIIRYGRRIIKEENIEIILAYSDHGPALFSSYLLHKITKKPLFIYFYDLYKGNNFPFSHRVLAKFLEPRLFKSAQKIFVMAEALGEHYKNMYKRDVFVIHNSLPIKAENFDNLLIRNNPAKIVFTGTIYWCQAAPIRNLIKAIEELKDENVQLWLYTPSNKKALNEQGIFESQRVLFKYGMPSEMSEIQKNADILFVPLTFEKEHQLLINTSSPGKTYEYLSSGRPILIHAPAKSYISQYGKKYNFAMVVDEDDLAKLQKGIVELLNNKKLVSEMNANARKVLEASHDAFKNSKAFQKEFYE